MSDWLLPAVVLLQGPFHLSVSMDCDFELVPAK